MGEEGVEFSLQFLGHTPSPREVRVGTQGGKLEVGTGAGAVGEHYGLAQTASLDYWKTHTEAAGTPVGSALL